MHHIGHNRIEYIVYACISYVPMYLCGKRIFLRKTHPRSFTAQLLLTSPLQGGDDLQLKIVSLPPL